MASSGCAASASASSLTQRSQSQFPPGLNGPQATGPDKKAIDRQNQQEIRADVTKLYEMVSELKDQIDKTDSTSTLSVSVVKKAQQIEKLAKQIKDLAKG